MGSFQIVSRGDENVVASSAARMHSDATLTPQDSSDKVLGEDETDIEYSILVPAPLHGEFMSSRTLYLDGEYLAKNPAWHVKESPWKAQQVLRMLRQNRVTPETICDVGCGAGEVLKQLQANLNGECAFWGYDVSPQAIDLAKAQQGAGHRRNCPTNCTCLLRVAAVIGA